MSSRTSRASVFTMVGETMTLRRKDIEREETSALSLMPEGLLDALTESQSIELIAYLMSTAPPPK